MSESKFKKWFRNNWCGWIESYEPRRGGGEGIADLQIVVNERLIPLELKIGEIKNDILYPHEIRPVQINWHRRLRLCGVKTVIIIAVAAPKNNWRMFVVNAPLESWRAGYNLQKNKVIEMSMEKLYDYFNYHIRGTDAC